MAESRHSTSFSSLELQVNDLAALTQINGLVFENITQSGGPQGNWVCNHQTYLLLSFLVGELSGRAIRLEEAFEAALAAQTNEGRKAA